MEGNLGADAEYTACSAEGRESSMDFELAADADAGSGIAGVDSGALTLGITDWAAGIVLRTGSDTATLGCDAVTSGTPGTDAPGTRGKEKTSFRPAKCGSFAHGSVRSVLVECVAEGAL